MIWLWGVLTFLGLFALSALGRERVRVPPWILWPLLIAGVVAAFFFLDALGYPRVAAIAFFVLFAWAVWRELRTRGDRREQER